LILIYIFTMDNQYDKDDHRLLISMNIFDDDDSDDNDNDNQ